MHDPTPAPLAIDFDDSFVRALPADPEPKNRRRQVYGAGYSRVQPTPVPDPTLLAWSPECAALLGLPPAPDPEAAAQVFAGNRLLDGMRPYAACYGGHQFGNWAGQLGDGRAITLGETVHAGRRYELQLKGAGPTPYSRMADGRAVLRSSVREFLCSEAMHHLGVPTTRALSLVTTGEPVVRDMFYDGNPRPEPGAIVCRVAPSFVRFGSFEIFTARDDAETLKTLADYVIRSHFPEHWPTSGEPSPDDYAWWLAEVAERTARTLIHWMRVGFVHGVMNTDNLSILGLTIDYGPYGWLEPYDPGWTPNTTDAHGRRYRFGNQPAIGGWNLVRLAHALYPLVGAVEPLQSAVDRYSTTLAAEARRAWAAKLGLEERVDGGEDLNADLVGRWLTALQSTEVDYTLAHRLLADVPADAAPGDALHAIRGAFYDFGGMPSEVRGAFLEWFRSYVARLTEEGRPDAIRRGAMNRVNPKYVLRNYLAQLAIDDAEQGDPARLRETLDVMRDPYGEQPGREAYAARRPEWARDRPGCSTLSCSS